MATTTDVKIYKDSIGVQIILDTKEDLTLADEVSIKVKKPGGTAVGWVGAVYQVTKIKYVTEEDDLDLAGDYKLQAYVDFPDWKGRGGNSHLESVWFFYKISLFF